MSSETIGSVPPSDYEEGIPAGIVPTIIPNKPEGTKSISELPEPFQSVAELLQSKDEAPTRVLRKKKEDGGWIRLILNNDYMSQTTDYQIRQGTPMGETKTRESIYTYRVDKKNNTASCYVIINERLGSVIISKPEIRNEFEENDYKKMKEAIDTIKQLIIGIPESGATSG